MMFIEKLITPRTALMSGLLVGLLSHQASATEEIVVYGSEAVAAAAVEQAAFESERQDYLRSLNEQLKATLEQDLKRIAAPTLQIASSGAATRG
jgi:hypothetical protein